MRTSLSVIIPWSHHPIPVKKSVSNLKGWGHREPSTLTATTHPKSAFNIFKTPSREACWPPGRRPLSVVSENEKGKSLHFQQEKAEQRSHRWSRNPTGFSLSDKKKWMREGKAAGGCLGVMTDGLHSVSQSLSVINEAEVEIWGRCIHKAHGLALWNVSSHSPVVEQMLT